MSSIVFGIGPEFPLDVRMTAQAATRIVRNLGAVSRGFLIHALWAECAICRKEAEASVDLAVSDGNLAIDGNGRLVPGPNAHVPVFE